MKKLVLELGGNAGVIVDEDADLEFAAGRIKFGAFAYAGQVCISAQRVIVHEKVAAPFTERFVERARHLRTGDPLDEATELPNMIDEAAARRAEGWIK